MYMYFRHSKPTRENSRQCLKWHPYRNVNQSSTTVVLTKNKRKVKAYTVPYRKKKSWQKITNFFASDEFFCRLFFYRRLFLPTFFLRAKHLVFSNLKIPLVYLFDFKFN